MWDARDQGQGLGNGKDPRPGIGLGNTNPVATLGSTFGSSAPSIMRGDLSRPAIGELSPYQLTDAPSVMAGELRRAWSARQTDETFRIRPGLEANTPQTSKVPKPTAPVKLFQQVMNDWNFDDRAAATLLGFEAASDIRHIYLGNEPVGHRDANDRLRSVLRIATDLHDLFRDVSAIRGWLGEAKSDLGGLTPRSLLTEGSMENLLRVKHYVAYLSGR
jgi:hypothetical protein